MVPFRFGEFTNFDRKGQSENKIGEAENPGQFSTSFRKFNNVL